MVCLTSTWMETPFKSLRFPERSFRIKGSLGDGSPNLFPRCQYTLDAEAPLQICWKRQRMATWMQSASHIASCICCAWFGLQFVCAVCHFLARGEGWPGGRHQTFFRGKAAWTSICTYVRRVPGMQACYKTLRKCETCEILRQSQDTEPWCPTLV